MLSEKLMELVEQVQKGLSLSPKTHPAYVVADGLLVGCWDYCEGSCEDSCQGSCEGRCIGGCSDGCVAEGEGYCDWTR